MQQGCKFYQFIFQNDEFKICTLPGFSNLQLKLIDSHHLPKLKWNERLGGLIWL